MQSLKVKYGQKPQQSEEEEGSWGCQVIPLTYRSRLECRKEMSRGEEHSSYSINSPSFFLPPFYSIPIQAPSPLFLSLFLSFYKHLVTFCYIARCTGDIRVKLSDPVPVLSLYSSAGRKKKRHVFPKWLQIVAHIFTKKKRNLLYVELSRNDSLSRWFQATTLLEEESELAIQRGNCRDPEGEKSLVC